MKTAILLQHLREIATVNVLLEQPIAAVLAAHIIVEQLSQRVDHPDCNVQDLIQLLDGKLKAVEPQVSQDVVAVSARAIKALSELQQKVVEIDLELDVREECPTGDTYNRLNEVVLDGLAAILKSLK